MDLSANLYILGGNYNIKKKIETIIRYNNINYNNNKNTDTICIKPFITKFNDKASQLTHKEASFIFFSDKKFQDPLTKTWQLKRRTALATVYKIQSSTLFQSCSYL